MDWPCGEGQAGCKANSEPITTLVWPPAGSVGSGGRLWPVWGRAGRAHPRPILLV